MGYVVHHPSTLTAYLVWKEQLEAIEVASQAEQSSVAALGLSVGTFTGSTATLAFVSAALGDVMLTVFAFLSMVSAVGIVLFGARYRRCRGRAQALIEQIRAECRASSRFNPCWPSTARLRRRDDE